MRTTRKAGITFLSAMLLAGCGAPLDTSVDAAAVEADYAATYEQMVGTIAQRRAAEQLAYVRFQGQIRDCMRKAGFNYTPPPFFQMYDGYEHMPPPAEFSALVPVHPEPRPETGLAVTSQRERSRAHEARGSANPGFERLKTEDERRAYGVAGEACQPAQGTYTNLGSSKVSDQLQEQFATVLESANSRAAVKGALDGYSACMKSEKIPAKSVEDLRGKVMERFNAKESALGAAAPLRPGKPEWADVVQFEKQAAAADSRCRAEAHTLGMAALEPLLRTFKTEHASELKESEAVWGSVAREAAAALPRLKELDPSFQP